MHLQCICRRSADETRTYLPTATHSRSTHRHPSSRYLTKGHPNTDLGDGPKKIPTTRGTAQRLGPTPPQSRQITNYFLPLAIPDTDIPDTSPRVEPLIPASEMQFLPPGSTDSDLPIKLTAPEAATLPALSVCPSHMDGVTLFSLPSVSIALNQADIEQLQRSLHSLPTQLNTDPTPLTTIFGDCPLRVALKQTRADFQTVPPKGFCTLLVIDEVLQGPAIQALPHSARRTRLTDTIQQAIEACKGALPEATPALQMYHQHLVDFPLRDSLPTRHWMAADLLSPVLAALGSPHSVWVEDTPLLTPFNKHWMQLSVNGSLTTSTANDLLTLTQRDAPHIGFAGNHHFFLREVTKNLTADLHLLLQHVLTHVRALAVPSPTPVDSPPGQEHPVTFRLGGLQLSLSTRAFATVTRQIQPLPAADRFEQTRRLLHRAALTSCAFLPHSAHRPAIPGTGYCSIFALDCLTTTLPGQPFTDWSPDHTRARALLTRLRNSPSLSLPHGNCLATLHKHFAHAHSFIPRRHWPSLPMVATWANTLHPTAVWESDPTVPHGWLKLAALPEHHNISDPCGSAWTFSALTALDQAKHMQLVDHHFTPAAPLLTNLNLALDGLISKIVDIIADRLHWDRLQRLPSSAPPTPHPFPLTPRRVHFPDQPRIGTSFPLCSYAPPPLPLQHPALLSFNPPSPPPTAAPTHRHPRRAHLQPRVPHAQPVEDPGPLFELEAETANPSHILIGAATAPGSYYAAFAKHDLPIGTLVARYTSGTRRGTHIVHPTDALTSDGSYAISIPDKQGHWIEADAYRFNSCSARFIDEADTEADENCRFITHAGGIWVMTTTNISQYEQLRSRYGHEYWCNIKWPYALLQVMYTKYAPTLTHLQQTQWKAILAQRRTQDRAATIAPGAGILRVPPDHFPIPGPKFINNQAQHNRNRKHTQRQHKRAVRQGLTPPTRPIPDPPSPSPPDKDGAPALLPSTWTHVFPTDTMPHARLNVMSWSCHGRLYAYSNIINSGVRQFLQHVAQLIQEHAVDVMWLNDARFTQGTFDIYIPVLRQLLPNCRVIQFPTTYIRTGSRNLSYNQMGGAIAIVTHKWHGYIIKTLPDPTGAGLLNAIDLKIGTYSFRLINTYLLPTTSGGGPATLLTRIQRYLHGTTAPRWAKRLAPFPYQLAYLQQIIGAARCDKKMVIISGDFNRPLSPPSPSATSALSTWVAANHLVAPCQSTLHQLPDHYTWNNNSETQDRTTIDHVMYTGLTSHLYIHAVGTVHDPFTSSLSDHLPVWMTTSLLAPVSLPPPPTVLPIPPRQDIDMMCHQELEQYNAHLKTRLRTATPRKFTRDPHPHRPRPVAVSTSINGLAILLRHSALTVLEPHQGLGKIHRTTLAAKCQRARGCYKNGYSPHMRQLQVHLYFYLNLLRVAFSGRTKRQFWSPTTYLPLLLRWIAEWRKRYSKQLAPMDDLSPASDIPPPEHLTEKSFSRITREYILHCLKQVRSKLHGTQRRDMRRLISPEIRRRDELRDRKRLGELIAQLEAAYDGEIDLYALPCPIVGQITNLQEVQTILNRHFRDWYRIPEDLDPAADHMARHPHWWKTLIEYPDQPSLLHARSKIPACFQKGLRRVCAEKVTPDQKHLIHDRLADPITFAEFDAALTALTNGGAPGPSEATASMVKAWSPDIRKLAHRHMANIWDNKASPLWFKDKVIKLAPKIPGNTELNNMRPISLYEVLRKAWTTIVAKRIHLAWHQLGLLHPSQHGYRLDSGTTMALHTIINEIEDAHHKKKTKSLTFWDIKRAFDSIPRNIQKLAWLRLGVPIETAEWFVGLDDGGLSFISSPYYHHHKNLRSPSQLKANPGHFSGSPELAFEAERGIGQGESASSLMWTALYDILLDWIDPANRDLHQDEAGLEYSDQDVHDCKAAAYADDLATCAGGDNGPRMQQIITNWLSAFCAFAGLVIHPAKVYTTIIGPTPKHLQPPDAQRDQLIVHDLHWKPISCPVLHELESTKYLGIQLDLRGTLDTHTATLNKINSALSHLIVQPGSPNPKIDYIQFKLLPQVLATAICSNWSLKQYRDLDKPLSKIYRILLALPAKFPQALIYLPKSLMGIGIARLSDKAQLMKWEALARSQAVGADPGNSARAFLDRLPPSTSTTKDFVTRLGAPARWPRERFFARSIIEWLTEAGLNLAKRSIDPATLDENFSDNRRLDTMAEDLRLHPCSLYSDEDNQNLPRKLLTCTDGSFDVRPRGYYDIITAESELNCIGLGSGGMVFLPHGYDESHHTPDAVRIHSPTPLPGMNAFAWELVTQTAALHFIQHMPSYHVLTSDCKSAMARTNRSLATTNDQLANERGGIFATGAHQFSSPLYPRQFIHTKHHPERFEERRNNPTLRDKAICIADAVAENSAAKLGERKFPTRRHSLLLTDILPELIPSEHWHLRITKDDFPVIGDVLQYPHQVQLDDYTRNRDDGTGEHKWGSTAYSFANTLHPAPSRSYWKAARRTMTAFDWIGHGRNRAKLTPNPHTRHSIPDSQCRLCGALDSQQHCMLECTHPQMTPLREAAHQAQRAVILDQLGSCPPPEFKYFAQQFLHGSWSPSPNTSRIWLGMWNQDTLKQLIQPNLSSPLTKQVRRAYIKLAAKLTRPLTTAYNAMLAVIMKSPLSAGSTLPCRPVPPLLCNAMGNTFPQDIDNETPALVADLEQIYNVSHIEAFSFSDAACWYTQAAGAL